MAYNRISLKYLSISSSYKGVKYEINLHIKEKIMEDHAYIYFAQEGRSGAIKIGRTSNPLPRIASLQIGNPRKLRILGIFRVMNTSKSERYLHQVFKNYRLRGEWFKPCRAIFSEIKRLANNAHVWPRA